LIDDDQVESGQALALPLGAKLDVETMQHEVGGGAANTAVAFSRLGLQAATVSRVGDDFAGRLIKEVLTEEGVATRFLRVDKDSNTGQSVLILSPDGNRTVLVKRGAAADFELSDVDESVLTRAGWIYLSSIGGNMKELQQIFAICPLQDIKVAWTPGSLELAHGQDGLGPLLPQADVLLLNREEAAKLTKVPHGSVEEVLARLLEFVEQGVVVVTNGSEGAVAFDGQHTESLPGRDLGVVDATGAGDSFGSGFVAAHLLGLAMDKALSFAIANAESVIGHIGAQEGLLDRQHLDKQRVVKGIKQIADSR
jgi:sugar/nucleoside kinase (ribokinase family)